MTDERFFDAPGEPVPDEPACAPYEPVPDEPACAPYEPVPDEPACAPYEPVPDEPTYDLTLEEAVKVLSSLTPEAQEPTPPAAPYTSEEGNETEKALPQGERLAAPRSRWRVQIGSEVEPKPVEFLWNPYLPIGEVTMVMAAGGAGKTFALCGIAAEMSRGRRPMNGFDDFEPVHSLLISAEDRASVLRERLEKSDADLSYIHILDDAASVGLSLAADSGQALCEIIRAAGARFVVLDPLHAFIGDIDINRVNMVRPVMHALARVAKVAACSIVIVSHVSKRQSDGNANNMAIGSVDLVNACRSVLRVTGDETGANPNRRVLVQTKSNYAAYGDSIAFEVTDDGMRWLGFSALTRDVLEAASLSRQKLSDYVQAHSLTAAKDDELIEALLSLCRGQTEERAFYAYKTLRERFMQHFGSGYMKPVLDRIRGRLKEKGVEMEIGKVRVDSCGVKDRGVYLIKRLPQHTQTLF